MYTVLCGGVGGVKLALGLAQVLPADELTIIVNTADDLIWHGLYVSPDVDTVLYTLAGVVDPQMGWGVAGDTTVTLDQLADYGLEPWFRIGDRDLATHIMRTDLMKQMRYTEVVSRLMEALGVAVRVLPMSDAPVRTIVHTSMGDLEFQEYFVGHRAAVPVHGITFSGIETAMPSTEVTRALRDAEAILVGPSNPFVSIGPMLALPGFREQLREGGAPVVAVSPIVGGRALKGPAARMLAELGYEVSTEAVAKMYADFLDGFVLDRVDAGVAGEIEAMGMKTLVTDTVMMSLDDKERLAREVLTFARTVVRSA